MKHLTDFVNWLNEDIGGEGPLPNLLHRDYGQAMADSLKRHFAEDRQKTGVRMSNLGKPAVVAALAKLGYSEPDPKGKVRLIFHIGDMYENFIEIMMQAYGIEILESQPEVKYLDVSGHADFIIKSPVTGEPIVVEAKTMSDSYFRMFSKNPNDDRGYVTQLAMYANAKNHPATWLCFNKGTNETTEVETDQWDLATAVDRAEVVLEKLEQVYRLGDVLHTSGGFFRPPPPTRAERFQGQETGRYFLPQSMAYSAFRSALYKITEDVNGRGKLTEYFDGYADLEHMEKELAFLVDTGKVVYNDPYSS